ncbi:hypothetical protein DW064_13460, partial [Segatella copri]
VQKSISLLKDEMRLGQELKFKNKLCNLKLGTFFSALLCVLPGVLKLLPLQGDRFASVKPRALPWARSFCPFRACCF